MRELSKKEYNRVSGAAYEDVDNNCFYSSTAAMASAFMGLGAALIATITAIGACTSSSSSNSKSLDKIEK